MVQSLESQIVQGSKTVPDTAADPVELPPETYHLFANVARYVERAREVLANPDAMSDETLERARQALKTKVGELRAARLAAIKPTKTLLARIEMLFEPHEIALKSAESSIVDAIRSRLANAFGAQGESLPERIDILLIEEAEPLVTRNATDASDHLNAPKWQVQLEPCSVDRNSLDAGRLVRYLTDYQILAAAKKALKEEGQVSGKIEGVGYRVSPK